MTATVIPGERRFNPVAVGQWLTVKSFGKTFLG
jgi:hypothetical protein